MELIKFEDQKKTAQYWALKYWKMDGSWRELFDDEVFHEELSRWSLSKLYQSLDLFNRHGRDNDLHIWTLPRSNPTSSKSSQEILSLPPPPLPSALLESLIKPIKVCSLKVNSLNFCRFSCILLPKEKQEGKGKQKESERNQLLNGFDVEKRVDKDTGDRLYSDSDLLLAVPNTLKAEWVSQRAASFFLRLWFLVSILLNLQVDFASLAYCHLFRLISITFRLGREYMRLSAETNSQKAVVLPSSLLVSSRLQRSLQWKTLKMSRKWLEAKVSELQQKRRNRPAVVERWRYRNGVSENKPVDFHHKRASTLLATALTFSVLE